MELSYLKTLRSLYTERLLGETYTNTTYKPSSQKPFLKEVHESIETCTLCKRHQGTTPISGQFSPKAKLTFITLTPLLNNQLVFSDNLKASMLKNIIQKVFSIALTECNILSLLKCNSKTLNLEQEIKACLPHLLWQLDKSPSKLCVLFGETSLHHLLNLSKKESFGRIINYRSKNFLATHALEDMLKNPSLKKEALTHFKTALNFLNTL
ncbi:uracil-DNA glycosylase family protein [Helicobacter cetorum]|uniref:uracil-DNA glycosylase family protein n=1 Tax=Helicobacter cetorum TaxID=138563 RepID=UPI000CF14874|nr:uracil-DNA glycosylase family protein [Helicobacter cetorum]